MKSKKGPIKNKNNQKMTFKKGLSFKTIASVKLTSTNKETLLSFIAKRISGEGTLVVFTPNPEFLVYAKEHSWFGNLLTQSDINIPDGVGITLAARFLGKPLKGRITGVDFMMDLCQFAKREGFSVYLLGAASGVASAAAEQLKLKFPGLNISCSPGKRISIDRKTGRLLPKEAVEEMVEQVREVKPDFLFVGFGMGKQESFIADTYKRLGVKLAMGVGGSFDYISQKTTRAPLFIRKLGLEWLFRLINEPWRLKRQLKLLKFITLIFQEKFEA